MSDLMRMKSTEKKRKKIAARVGPRRRWNVDLGVQSNLECLRSSWSFTPRKENSRYVPDGRVVASFFANCGTR